MGRVVRISRENRVSLGFASIKAFPPLLTISFFHYTNNQLNTILHALGI